MNIRLLTAEDADVYRRIRLQALSEHPEAFSSSFEEESKYTAAVYRERFQSPDSFTFGAFEQENLIGTVTLLKETKLKLKHRSHIVGMYVSSDMRKQGVGNALLSAAIKLAKELNDIEQVYLAVEKKNTAARKLYSSFGFEVYGEEKRALKIGDEYFDEEHMVLFL